MRKSKKQLLRTLMACGLVVSVAAGGTVAYLTDAETATNTFTVGKVKIDLEEPGYPGNDSDEVKNIIPNQEIVKDPQIENTGNNDALVFLRVEVPQEEFTELDADNNVGEKKLQDLFKLKNVSEQWELLRTETTTDADGKVKTSYVYGYKKTLAKGSTTDKLFQKVQMKNSIEKDLEGNVEDVIVTACAIQATDIPDVDLTPGSDGTLGKDVLDQVYTIFLNQSSDQKSRPADEGDRNQTGKLGKIAYELDGGTLADGTLTEYGSVDYGYTPPEPTKEGYTFAGWSPASIPADSTGNVTFTASWEVDHAVANLLDGETLNTKMKTLAGDASPTNASINRTITAIQQSDSAPSASVMAEPDSLISTDKSEKPIYMWFEDGTIKWWSGAKQVIADTSLSNLCRGLPNLADISGLKNWNTENVTDMNSAFYGCSALTSLTNLENWDTSNVTDMHEIFSNCTGLTSLSALRSWNTTNVTNMRAVFFACSSLANLNGLENWNTENVTNTTAMFSSCRSLSSLAALKNWDIGNVIEMSSMFYGCRKLINLEDLATWNTGNVKNMGSVFFDCSSLTSLNGLSSWDIGNVTTLLYTFSGCTSLADASAINDWDITKLSWGSFTDFFKNCPSHPNFTKRAGTWYNGTFTPTD